ncbi:hypothetical protein EJ110_NYTH56577 [Nymphaea thermarum]|nr:hypothetical protein EJ110_NYTH56577 [Nymphaea thermarum]
MADAVIPKIDDVLDTGSNTKSENLPVHITSIQLNKDNYLSWSAALEIGITSRGRLHYITGEKPAPSKADSQWATWALEDSQACVISLNPYGDNSLTVMRFLGSKRCMLVQNLRNNGAILCILTPVRGVHQQPL